jgi:hypothetical protein
MKRTNILCLLGFVLISFSLQAQAPLKVGKSQLNAGFGFSSWGLPIYAGMEFGFLEDVTLGGEVFYSQYSDGWGGLNWNHTIINLSAVGNYHFNTLLNVPSKFDVYGGLALGYSIFNHSYSGPGSGLSYNGDTDSGLFLGMQIGGRYFFSDKWAVNLQLGGGSNSGGRIGVTYLL